VVESRQSLKVQVPSPKEDAPRLGRVGVIAAVGFALGILWPWLAGISLVPSAPVEKPVEAAEPEAGVAPAAARAAPGAAEAAPEPAPAERLRIGEVQITSCRDERRRQQKDCGSLGIDQVARERLASLVECEGAKGAIGTLSLGFDLNFGQKTVRDVRGGKSSSLPAAAVEALLGCLKPKLLSMPLAEIEHRHNEYTVFYLLDFLPESIARTPEPEAVQASGTAVVSWQVALIRAEPKEGPVLSRLLSGTRVIVTGRQGDWYRVKYDAKGNEGWVHKSAIGM
jgi:hypothetical protein